MCKRLIGVMLILVTILVACGKKDETPVPTATVPIVETVEEVEQTTAVESVTIRFAVNDFEQALYQELSAAFEEDNPDIKIKLVSINEALGLEAIGGQWPDDAWTRLASTADVINVHASKKAVEAGLLLNLAPQLESDPTAEPDDFFPGALSNCQWEGGTWCLPSSVNYQLIFFDKDAFDAVGEPYPEPGWTWEEFLLKATAVTRREGDEVVMWGFVLPYNQHVDVIANWVEDLVDTSSTPYEPRFDRPEVQEAVQWYTDLYQVHQVLPFFELSDESETGLTLPEGQSLIDQQRVAMWPNPSLLWGWLGQQRNLGVVPFPIEPPISNPKGDQTTPMGVDAVSVSAGTADAMAAWRWANYLSLQKMEIMGLQMMPARRSAAEASGFWEAIDNELGTALEFALEHAHVEEREPGYNALNNAIDRILAGDATVVDALAEAQEEAQLEIEEEATGASEATPAPTVAVASEEETSLNPNATTIVFTAGPSNLLNLGTLRDLATKFNEGNPDIVVEVRQPNIYAGASLTFRDLAQDADCFGWLPQFQDPDDLDAILNLEPFLDADSSFNTDDFFPVFLDRFTYQGQLWGIPSEGGTYIIEYNKDLFDQAGVDYPSVSQPDAWTTDAFLQTALALTQGEGDEKIFGFVPNFYEVNDVIFFVERLGAQLLDEDVDPPNVDFSDESVINAMEWYIALGAEYAVKPVYVGDIADLLTAPTGTVEREALIDSGRGAMWTAAGAQNVLSDREGLSIGVAPLPSDADTSGVYVSAEGYFISAETQARQECWAWLTFLTDQSEAVQSIPARRSVAESKDYRQRVGDDRADTYLETMEAADRPSSLQFLEDEPWMGVGLIWLGKAYSQAAKGEIALEEALAQAQDTFDRYRACVVANDALTDDTAQQACVIEVDPSFPAFIFGQ